MKTKKIGLNFKGKKLEIEAGVCEGLQMGIGLMFKSKNTKPLIFDFKKKVKEPITALFVFFPFLAIFLDDKNKILETRIVKPFTFITKPKQKFSKLLEIPINDKYKRELKILVG